MGTMILKGGGVGRGWIQFSLISQSSLESRKSRSLGDTSLSVSVPQCGGCVPVWWGVPQCKRVCPSVGGCVQAWEGVSLCVCRSMGGCVPVREGLPQRRRVGGMCMCLCHVLMGGGGVRNLYVYMRMSVIVTCTDLCINM